MFKKNDRVIIKSLTYTKGKYGLCTEMARILTGTVTDPDEEDEVYVDDEVYVKLDGTDHTYCYDPKDLILATYDHLTPTSVKTSGTKTTVTFADGKTTSVNKSEGDPYELETAIAYCIAKRVTTNSHIKRLAETSEEVVDKVTSEFYNKFLKPYGFLNESPYIGVEIETLKNYLKTLKDVRSEMALIAIENNLTKDELFDKLKG